MTRMQQIIPILHQPLLMAQRPMLEVCAFKLALCVHVYVYVYVYVYLCVYIHVSYTVSIARVNDLSLILFTVQLWPKPPIEVVPFLIMPAPTQGTQILHFLHSARDVKIRKTCVICVVRASDSSLPQFINGNFGVTDKSLICVTTRCLVLFLYCCSVQQNQRY